MTDPFDYEPRLEARLVAHAARATRPFDAMAIAASAAAAAAPRRTLALPLLRPSTGRAFAPVAAMLVLVGLLVALIGAMLLSGGRPPFPAFVAPAPSASPDVSATPEASVPAPSVEPSVPAPSPTPAATPAATSGSPLPAGSRELLVVTVPQVPRGQLPCDDVDAYDTTTTAVRRIISCADRVAITPDGSTGAVGNGGLDIIELRNGAKFDIMKTEADVFPIAWSPSGRWIQYAGCGHSETGPCTVVIGNPDSDRTNLLPAPKDGGYWGDAQWLPDESHILVPDGQGWLIGNADGSRLKRLPEDSPLALYLAGSDGFPAPAALSPDGTRVAYRWGPYVDGRPTVGDLWVTSLDGTDKRNLTNLEPGAQVRAVAWSPDGKTIAFVKGLPGADGRLPSSTVGGPNELWLIDQGGAMHRVDAPGALYAPFDTGTLPIRWSPDGSRFTVEVATDPSVSSIDTITVSMDGSSPVVLKDARWVQWARDGRSLAFVGTTGPSSHLEGDTIPPRTIDVANADGSNRHVVARPTDAPTDFWFTWAAR